MKRFRLLLLDANVVIELFDQGIWDRFIEQCEVLVSQVVVEEEAMYYHEGETPRPIDLVQYIADGRITQVAVTASTVAEFRRRFDPIYLEKLDPGESEALAYLLESKEPCLICSGDAIVFRVLGRFQLGERGLSLEEILKKIGLGRALDGQYSKSFRTHWTGLGVRDAITDTGLAKSVDKKQTPARKQ